MATMRNPAEGAISGLSIRKVSKEEMLKRTARFKDLKSSREAFVDSLIPGGEREIFNVIGTGVTEDPSLSPAITAVEDFNLTFVKAEPGKGAALHYHPTVEVFMPASGKWAVFCAARCDARVSQRRQRNRSPDRDARRHRRRPRHLASEGARGREEDTAPVG